MEKEQIRFPGFETYEPPEKDAIHNDDVLTEEDIKALADAEREFQKAKKKQKQEQRDEEKRQRAIDRVNRL